MAWHTQLLVYGTTALSTYPFQGDTPYAAYSAAVESGTTTVLSSGDSALVYSAMFGDACAFIGASDFVAPGFNMARCRVFGGGVLTQGLLALVDRWYQQSYIEAEINLRAFFWNGTDPATNVSYLSEGYGWIIPSDDYNYSDIACTPPCLHKNFDLPCSGCAPLAPTFVPDAFCGGTSFFDCSTYQPPPAPMPFPGTLPLWVGDILNDDGTQFVLEADAMYLTPGFRALAQVYADTASANSAQVVSFLLVFVPVWLFLLLLYICLVFVPLVFRLNMEIQTKRGMLLLLPLEVVAHVKALRELIESISSKDRRAVSSAPEAVSGGGGTAAAEA